MERKIGLVHAGCFNARLFGGLFAEAMPGAKVVHLVDEGLPYMSDPRYRENVLRRLRCLASFAEESGAEIIMLTCTAFGRLADEVHEAVNVPVLSVLEIMTDEAMSVGDSIGILGTHPGTVTSATQMVKEQAELKGKKVGVTPELCEGGFDALMREDWATHDRIVREHLEKLMARVKVVVVPQPSVERVVEQIAEPDRRVPVLSSARLSVQRLKEKLESMS
jgi:aspartate/glutamate racemase